MFKSLFSPYSKTPEEEYNRLSLLPLKPRPTEWNGLSEVFVFTLWVETIVISTTLPLLFFFILLSHFLLLLLPLFSLPLYLNWDIWILKTWLSLSVTRSCEPQFMSDIKQFYPRLCLGHTSTPLLTLSFSLSRSYSLFVPLPTSRWIYFITS